MKNEVKPFFTPILTYLGMFYNFFSVSYSFLEYFYFSLLIFFSHIIYSPIKCWPLLFFYIYSI